MRIRIQAFTSLRILIQGAETRQIRYMRIRIRSGSWLKFAVTITKSRIFTLKTYFIEVIGHKTCGTYVPVGTKAILKGCKSGLFSYFGQFPCFWIQICIPSPKGWSGYPDPQHCPGHILMPIRTLVFKWLFYYMCYRVFHLCLEQGGTREEERDQAGDSWTGETSVPFLSKPVLWIRDILVRIRIRGSVPVSYVSGSRTQV